MDPEAGRPPRHLSLIGKLRGEPEALLGVREEDVRAWLAAGEQLASEIGRELLC